MHFGDVVDQFHDQNSFANTGTTEEANFTTLRVGGQQINNFDACFQNFRFSRLVFEQRRRLVNGAFLAGFQRLAFIHRLADDVQDTAQCYVAHGHHDGTTCVSHFLTTNEAFSGVHCDTANSLFTKVL